MPPPFAAVYSQPRDPVADEVRAPRRRGRHAVGVHQGKGDVQSQAGRIRRHVGKPSDGTCETRPGHHDADVARHATLDAFAQGQVGAAGGTGVVAAEDDAERCSHGKGGRLAARGGKVSVARSTHPFYDADRTRSRQKFALGILW